MATNSIVTFFHLILEHRLVDAQDWVYTNAWTLHIFVTVTSFFMMTRLLMISLKEQSMSTLIRNELIYDLRNKESFVVTTTLVITCLFLGAPKINPLYEFNLWFYILSYIGHLVLLVSHVIFFLLVTKIVALNRNFLYLSALIFLCLVSFSELYFMKFTAKQNIIIFVFLGLCLYFSSLAKRPSLKIALSLVFFAVPPVMVFLGQDFLWGKAFSPYLFDRPLVASEVMMVCLLLGLYPWITKRLSRMINHRQNHSSKS